MMRRMLRRLANDAGLYALVTRVRVTDADIRVAEAVIDRTDLAEWCEQQLHTARQATSGRKRALTCRTLLVALLALAMAGQPMHLRRAHELLHNLPDVTRQRLGVPEGVTERQVGYLYRRLIDVLDPSEHTQPDLDDERARRRKLLDTFTDKLLDATLPDERAPRQSYSLDATTIGSWGRGWRNVDRRVDRDAGWSVKTAEGATALDADGGDHRPRSRPGADRFVYGYEIHGFTWVREDHTALGSVPALTERIRIYKGGNSDIDEVMDAFDTIGADLGDVVVDRWYSQHLPERFAHRIRASGGHLVADLKADQRGLDGTYLGATLIDGRLHCPSTPEGLHDLPDAHWRSRKQMDEQAAVAARRQVWELSPLTARRANGHQRMRCPAEAGKVRCPLKPESMDLDPALPTLAEADIPEHHGRVCLQRSITVPPRVAPKTYQKHAWGTAEWRESYNRRNTVEGVFGVLKTEGAGGLKRDDIRVTGIAAFTVMVSMCMAAANLLLAMRWEQRQTDEPDDDTTTNVPPRRRARARRRVTEADLVRRRDGPDAA